MSCETYIALLRGINVSGSNLIKMDDLKRSIGSLGYNNVRTYIQSGNIIFEADTSTGVSPAQMIQDIIHRDFGLSVPVLLKSRTEWDNLVRENPFLPGYVSQIENLYLSLLERPAEQSLIRKILQVESFSDRWEVVDDRIYLYCPQGYGNTKFSNTFFEKKLNTRATTRNWKTILKLQEMSG